MVGKEAGRLEGSKTCRMAGVNLERMEGGGNTSINVEALSHSLSHSHWTADRGWYDMREEGRESTERASCLSENREKIILKQKGINELQLPKALPDKCFQEEQSGCPDKICSFGSIVVTVNIGAVQTRRSEALFDVC